MRDWINLQLSKVGETKAGLARHLGLPFARISDIIKGNRELKTKELLLFSDFLQMDPIDVIALFSPSDVVRKITPIRSVTVKGHVQAGTGPKAGSGTNQTFIMWPFYSMQTFLEWVNWQKRDKKITQVVIGKALGISQPQVSDLLNGERDIKVSEVSVFEKLFGESYFGSDVSEPAPSDYRTVSEYDVRASAGPGLFVGNENVCSEWKFNKSYLNNFIGVQNSKLAVIEVRGDSMHPTLLNGDRILIDLNDKSISQPGIFVLFDGDGTVVKRVEKAYDSEKPMISLVSDNTKHRSYKVRQDLLSIVGRVVWASRKI